MADLTIAKTTTAQMGGTLAFVRMLGLRTTFVSDARSVTVRWPSRTPSRGNAMRVTLAGDDTYSVCFWNIRGTSAKVVREVEGIYADALVDLFESQTGYALRVPRVVGL